MAHHCKKLCRVHTLHLPNASTHTSQNHNTTARSSLVSLSPPPIRLFSMLQDGSIGRTLTQIRDKGHSHLSPHSSAIITTTPQPSSPGREERRVASYGIALLHPARAFASASTMALPAPAAHLPDALTPLPVLPVPQPLRCHCASLILWLQSPPPRCSGGGSCSLFGRRRLASIPLSGVRKGCHACSEQAGSNVSVWRADFCAWRQICCSACSRR